MAPQFEGGVEAAEQVLASGATAVLAYNDLVAAGILSRLAQLGVEVPGALSVVGFDDIPLAAMLTPALTTVAAPTAQAGAAAVEALLSRLERPRRGARRASSKLPATLVVRGSTARARPRANHFHRQRKEQCDATPDDRGRRDRPHQPRPRRPEPGRGAASCPPTARPPPWS